MEDDDVANLGAGEVVDEAIDKYPLTDVEGRLHRAGGDLVRLDQEGLDPERQPQGQGDDHHQLDETSASRGRLGDGRVQDSSPAPFGSSASPAVSACWASSAGSA